MNEANPKAGLFVTGTDTGVGKTYIAAEFLRQQNQPWQVRKPIESGCESRNGELYPADGHTLQRAAGEREALQHITPHRFIDALAPDRAARHQGAPIYLQNLLDACAAKRHPHWPLLVEGAGGICSPLAEDALNLDLAAALNLPVMLVIADRLGCINHTLLSLMALQSRQLQVRYLVLNSLEQSHDTTMNNREDIERLTGLKLSHCQAGGSANLVCAYD